MSEFETLPDALNFDPTPFPAAAGNDPAAAPQGPVPTRGFCSNQPTGGPLLAFKPEPVHDTRAMGDTNKLWPNGAALQVVFVNGNDPWSQTVQQAIRKLAPTWSDYANITFRFDQPQAHIIVNMAPIPSLGVGIGSYNCWLGVDCFKKLQQGIPSMNLVFHPGWANSPQSARELEFSRAILHEFGHSLGLIHEHARPDVNLNWNVPALMARIGWSEKDVNEQIVKRYTDGPLKGGSFDLFSIMMYEYQSGEASYPDGRPFQTPNNTVLSPEDKVVANMLYPKTNVDSLPEGALVPGDSKEAAINLAGQVATYRFKPKANAAYAIETQGATPLLVSITPDRTNPVGRMLAVESPGTPLFFRAVDDNQIFIQVRHGLPMKGTGAFKISLRQV